MNNNLIPCIWSTVNKIDAAVQVYSLTGVQLDVGKELSMQTYVFILEAIETRFNEARIANSELRALLQDFLQENQTGE